MSLQKILVWDIPVRVFHWSIVILVGLAWYSGEQGGLDWMEVHLWCGYGILTLVLFRVLWGFVGGAHARFTDFVRGPVTAWRYARRMFGSGHQGYLGHNPLGGWSVLMLLLLLLIQAGTGLFASDDILIEGPLYDYVSSDTSRQLTSLHKLNFNILLAFIGLHLLAIISYLLFKKENLVHPMLSGYKKLSSPPATRSVPASGNLGLALGLLALCAGGVYALMFML